MSLSMFDLLLIFLESSQLVFLMDSFAFRLMHQKHVLCEFHTCDAEMPAIKQTFLG